jgi:beta-glucosidase
MDNLENNLEIENIETENVEIQTETDSFELESAIFTPEELEKRINSRLKQMTVTEKAMLCQGRNFWFVRGIRRLGIQPYMVADGPHGLRKQADAADHLGMNLSKPATCFPTACSLASSWDKDLAWGIGERIGKEAKMEQVGIVLGPGANIKRSPLCGRNFEYFSEDPYLSSTLASSWIQGIQSEGTGASLKHYAVNNQESDRLRVDAVVDERALREIYLASFETAVKESKPYTLMCSYNKINGEFGSENKKLCEDILRGEWGFDGYVMTDWGAANDRVKAIKAGIELEMPGGIGETVFDMVKAVESGDLTLESLDEAVRRLLRINLKVKYAKVDDFKIDKDEHHAFAAKAAAESAVLMKNDSNFLPLSQSKKVIAIGGLFNNMRYQGSGSSLINPYMLASPYDAFVSNFIEFDHYEGFSAYLDKVDETAQNQAVKAVESNQDAYVIVFAGLTMFYESEGFDRAHMRLPENQNALIDRLCEINKNVVVVLYGGSPAELPWIDKVKAVINMYLPGQAGGDATFDVLYGNVNPSGKLAETWPIKLEDTPCFNYFPGGTKTVEYRESIFVGYRYYDTAKIKPLFPFGFGLSYTKFEYSDIKISKPTFKEGDLITVKATVKNIGNLAGKETAMLFVKCKNSAIWRAEKELKGYQKVSLEKGESKTVEFTLDARSFAFYNAKENKWDIEPAVYEILIGQNAEQILLTAEVTVKNEKFVNPYEGKAEIEEYYNFKGTIGNECFKALLGVTQLEEKDYPVGKKVHWNTSLYETQSVFGKFFNKVLAIGSRAVLKKDKSPNKEVQANMVQKALLDGTMRWLSVVTGGLGKKSVQGLMKMLSGFGGFFAGAFMLLKGFFTNKKQSKLLKALENGEA